MTYNDLIWKVIAEVPSATTENYPDCKTQEERERAKQERIKELFRKYSEEYGLKKY